MTEKSWDSKYYSWHEIIKKIKKYFFSIFAFWYFIHFFKVKAVSLTRSQ